MFQSCWCFRCDTVEAVVAQMIYLHYSRKTMWHELIVCLLIFFFSAVYAAAPYGVGVKTLFLKNLVVRIDCLFNFCLSGPLLT